MEQGLGIERGPEAWPVRFPVRALQQVDEALVQDVRRREEEGEEPGDRRFLVCKTCGTAITTEESGIVVNGSHRHTFMNPRGVVFHIGCFSGAGGCYVMGAPTDEYTWFPGHTWSYVLCSGCLSHLGWHFQSSAGGFFGLIIDQLELR